MQFIILIPYVYTIFVSKNKVKVRLEKKITFKVFIASCGSLFQELEVIHPQENCASYVKSFSLAADNRLLKNLLTAFCLDLVGACDTMDPAHLNQEHSLQNLLFQ